MVSVVQHVSGVMRRQAVGCFDSLRVFSWPLKQCRKRVSVPPQNTNSIDQNIPAAAGSVSRLKDHSHVTRSPVVCVLFGYCWNHGFSRAIITSQPYGISTLSQRVEHVSGSASHFTFLNFCLFFMPLVSKHHYTIVHSLQWCKFFPITGLIYWDWCKYHHVMKCP